ncbi:pentatricopeptide repeat-containing protein At2g13600 [Cryptomeria japonica]|uniref:pentatricopeptide repeat-containing protein At2g13600 n=1 Tax=Cryptomeria japonica TaxID=3369 RepID=UPI0027DA911B|nr:pentatricopeptide repeat-containing protein At2g13600 [Cryptomeria japonica]XP_057862803.2 pentatricopeptide repeat-containing protein At2g13600 [Cryptomeria japonica]
MIKPMPAPSINLTALCKQGRLNEALHILLTSHNPPAYSSIYLQLLQTCIVNNALSQGKQIHSLITHRRFLFTTCAFFQNNLINMYVKCGSLVNARKVFDDSIERDASSWNTMIAAYRRHGCPQESLELFYQMQRNGMQPDQFTFASILPACAKMRAFEQGIAIHQTIIEKGFLSDVVVASAVVDMYAKCGSIHKARELFDRMPGKNVVSWNAMIAGYAQNGALEEASRLFKEMPQPDVVSWNSMIAGYAQNGFAEKASETFKQMQCAGLNPNSTTFIIILPACAKMGAVEQGMHTHQSIIESGFVSNIVVANALIDMYAKCGNIHSARNVFDRMLQRDVVSWNAMIVGYAQSGVLDEASRLFDGMPQRNVVSWNAMISGYAQNGFVENALETFKQMRLAGVKPDSTTFASILPSFAKMGALEQGRNIHQIIIENGFLSDGAVANALIDMYAKCGIIHQAYELFDNMPRRNIVSWTAMIAGYAQNGYCKDALKLFELMKHRGTCPDNASFSCVLFACSHAGLVAEGCKYFNSISYSYCITPTFDHYVGMVDLLGRAGYLEETLNFIIKMPFKPVIIVWMCLFAACRSHKNMGLGMFAATRLFELDPENAASYVLLSNIYAEVGRWSEVQKVRRLMKDRGIKKTPGCSWIESHQMVHAFGVGDQSHQKTQEIYAKLEKLSWEMKAAGYSLDSKHELNDVKDEKE